MYYCQYPNSWQINRLISYINEFPAESLTKIDMNTRQPLEEFKNPFPNDESVDSSDSLSCYNDMSIIFRKLRRLICFNFCNTGSITPIYCPNLEHSKFSNKNAIVIDDNKRTIADILHLNPLLQVCRPIS